MSVLFNENVKDSLVKGVQLMAKAVGTTFGPDGKNVIIKHQGGIHITKDGATVAQYVSDDDPVAQMAIDVVREVATKTAKDVGDGPQPLYSKILTPNGWVEMGNLKVGDEICGTDMTIQKILGIFPKGQKEIYKLKFSNGQEVECCEDHLWTITTNNNSTKTLPTIKLFNDPKLKSKNKDGSNSYKYYINTTIVDFPKKDFALDPYVVGLLIGDGSLTGNGSIELSLALNQRDALKDMRLPEGIKYTVKEDLNKHYLRVKFSKVEQYNENKSMFDYVREIGLLGTNSSTKFIPNEYLYSDYESRLRLLKGLTVTDGHINKKGLLEYSTISEKLSNNVVELLRGLGKQVNYRLKERKNDKQCYSNKSIYVITELKGYKHGLKLIGIEKTGVFTEMQCIKVSNPNHLYITNDYVCTHNTTTSVILTDSIVQILKDSTENPISIQRGLQQDCKKVIEYLESNKKDINTFDDIKKVASISANNDENLGTLIATAYEKVGKYGIVNIEESSQVEDSFEFVEGIQLESGYLSPFFINTDKNTCELENVLVFISQDKLKDSKQILEIAGEAIKQQKTLLIIAPEIDSNIQRILLLNRGQRLESCCIKSPNTGIYRDTIIKDLKFTLGSSMTCQKVIITKEDTTLIGCSSDSSNESIIEEIQRKLDGGALTEPELIFHKKRLANFLGGVCTIKVGGYSTVEIKEKKDRVEDAVCATKAALDGGVLPGGGRSLEFCANHCKDLKYLKPALLTPINILHKNAEVDELYNDDNIWIGHDLKNDKLVDMYDAGIVDPFLVTKTALENAISAASLILTNGCSILKVN